MIDGVLKVQQSSQKTHKLVFTGETTSSQMYFINNSKSFYQICLYKWQSLPIKVMPDAQEQQQITLRGSENWRLMLTWTCLHSQDQPSSPVKEERQNQPRLLLSAE